MNAPFSKRLKLGSTAPRRGSAAAPTEDDIEDDSDQEQAPQRPPPAAEREQTVRRCPPSASASMCSPRALAPQWQQRSSLVNRLSLPADQLGEAASAGGAGRAHSRRQGPLGMLAQRVVSASASDGQLLLVKHRPGSVLSVPDAIEAARSDPSQFLVLRLQRVLASGLFVTAECEQLAGAQVDHLDAAGRRRVILNRSVCEHALQARHPPTPPCTACAKSFSPVRRQRDACVLVFPPWLVESSGVLLAQHARAV